MLYDSGVLYVCNLSDTAEAGMMPVQRLVRVNKYWYGERTVGYTRFYTALGANEQIDLLVRIPQDRRIRIGQYAELGNGEQYRITYVSNGVDDSSNRWTDLTLRRLEEFYDVADSVSTPDET